MTHDESVVLESFAKVAEPTKILEIIKLLSKLSELQLKPGTNQQCRNPYCIYNILGIVDQCPYNVGIKKS